MPTHSTLPTFPRSVSLASLASLKSLKSLKPSPKAVRRLVVPLLILAFICLCSATQTEVAHHLTADLDYNQPYFTFFLTHVTFSLVFPLHLAILYFLRPEPIGNHIEGLRHVIATQLGERDEAPWKTIAGRWSFKMTWLTLLISIPALSWFIAMVFTSALDVTTIYATSSFHAYFFSMMLLKTPLSRTTVGSIALAFAGVIVIAFAGTGGRVEEGGGPRNRGLGDLVMMFGEY